MIYWQLFAVFFQIGLFSFGGGYASLPLIEEQIVYNHKWITMSEYMDLVAISGMTPGPIAINASTFIGSKLAGIPGSLAATAGCVAPSCLIVGLIAAVYYKYRTLKTAQGILQGLKPASAGLIASAGLSLTFMALLDKSGFKTEHMIDITAIILFALSVIAVQLKANQIAVMSACGIIYAVLISFR